MPILWRYLIKEYIKVFFLSILAFIAILLITRLKEIANFTALASNKFSILLYTLYQIPHILPIAIPISCLISSILLFQKLSQLNELTAIRASGISLKMVIAPLLLVAFVISLSNFVLASEITPRTRAKSKELLHENTSVNPIVLLQRKQRLSQIKNSYVEIEAHNNDQIAKNILIISPNKQNDRLFLIMANTLSMNKDKLLGSDISLISYFDSHKKDFDHLFIENQKSMSIDAYKLSQMIKSKSINMAASNLPIKMLLINSKQSKSKEVKIASEIARRIAISLAALSFTFIGITFGIQHRKTNVKNILIVSCLCFFILFGFTVGRALKNYYFPSICVYILPQVIVLIYSFIKIKKISRGQI